MSAKTISKRLIVSATILLGMSFEAGATGFTALGIRSCSEWNQRAKEPQARMIFGNWVLGYISATAMFNSRIEGTDLLKKINPEKLVAYMDNYCELNPTKTNVDGAITIEFLVKKNPQVFE